MTYAPYSNEDAEDAKHSKPVLQSRKHVLEQVIKRHEPFQIEVLNTDDTAKHQAWSIAAAFESGAKLGKIGSTHVLYDERTGNYVVVASQKKITEQDAKTINDALDEIEDIEYTLEDLK